MFKWRDSGWIQLITKPPFLYFWLNFDQRQIKSSLCTMFVSDVNAEYAQC